MLPRFEGLAGWQKNSFIDFPGTVSTVLFFSGCNLQCPYCHNPSFITNPEDLSGLSDDIWGFLKKKKHLIDGVVLSGGEPALHPCITSLVSDIQALGYRIKLDTNGLLPERIREFSPDYIALDIKTDPALYTSLLNAKFNNVKERLTESISIVKEMKNSAEVRITLAPGLINRRVISVLKLLLDGIKKVYLQPVNLKGDVLNKKFFTDLARISEEETEYFKRELSSAVESCVVRN